MNILVTGAAGFIGSVVVERLLEKGHSVVAIDDLRYGHIEAVHPSIDFIETDIVDGEAVERAFGSRSIDAVAHLAAEAYIDESIRDPGRFYAVNVTGGVNLLEAMRRRGIGRFVFSSTAAVYGEPKTVPILEDDLKEPVNAYGESKLAFERALIWFRRSFGLRHVSFRYFNACGASQVNGEDRKKETHIIPLLFQVAQGRRPAFTLFGTDYDTPDGTCVRDYVHVADIADAHVLALENVDRLEARAYNLGTEKGFSNLEVIEAVRKVTGAEIPVINGERRPGDPATLVASSRRASEELGWTPRFADLESMVASAWEWRKSHPNGYSQ